MIRKLLSLTLTLLTILTACGAPAPDGYDWCYVYNFAESDYDINIVTGVWVDGAGLQTDGTGLLQANWVHGELVTPAVLIVKVTRPSGVTGDVTVTANAIAFGVGISFTQTLPAGFTEVIIPVEPETAGESGTSVNFTLDASAPLNIESFEVRGRFDNPFPVNFCGQFTPSPSPAPTINTPTPTPTSTGTVTASPTATPFIDSCYLNFAYQQYGFTPIEWFSGSDPSGYYIPYEGFRVNAEPDRNGNQRVIAIEQLSAYFAGFRPTQYTIYFVVGNTTIDVGATVVGINGSTTTHFWADSGAYNVPLVVSDGTGAESNRIRIIFNSATNNAPDRFVDSVLITGLLIQGYDLGDCDESTPTPTRTQLPTTTPGTPTPSRTPIIVRTPTPNITLTPSGTPTIITSTPPATRTPIPAPTSIITPTIDPSDPNPNPNTENEAEWEILDSIGEFFTWVKESVTNLFDGIGQIGNWVIGTSRNFVSLFMDWTLSFGTWINNVGKVLSRVVDVGITIFDIIRRIMELVIQWLYDAILRLAKIIGAFFSAPLIPIPTLPQCFTAPMDHDLCAMYFLLDYTLFSPLTPGQFIVPLLVIVQNLFLILFFVRNVLSLFTEGAKTANGAPM